MTPSPLTRDQVLVYLANLRPATVPGRSNDGSRIHLHYRAIPGRKLTDQEIEEARRADELGLNRDRFTGRYDHAYISVTGDLVVVMLVELERDHKFRSFNVDRGKVFRIVHFGD